MKVNSFSDAGSEKKRNKRPATSMKKKKKRWPCESIHTGYGGGVASERGKGENTWHGSKFESKKTGAGGRIFVLREDRKSSGGRRCEVFRMEGQFVVLFCFFSF